MEINNYIENRWSPRAFADKTIELDLLKSLFTAGGRAPSSSNEQPWSFMMGKAGSNTYDLIYSTLVDFNKVWCKTAPVLVIGIVDTISEKSGEENKYAKYDLGASVAHLTMKAFDHNLFVHQMAGFDAEKCNELFHIPENHKTVVAFAIGYLGDKNQLPEKIAALENGVSDRKPVEDYLFEDEWKKKTFR